MRATHLLVTSALVLTISHAPPVVSHARADDEVEADDEEPPPPDEPPSPEHLLTMLGGDREDEALPQLRRMGGDVLPVARRLLETATEPRLLIGAAEWVAEKVPPPLPGKVTSPDQDRAAAVRRRLATPGDQAPRAALLEALGALAGDADLGTLDHLVREVDADAVAAARGLCRSRLPDAMNRVVYALRDLGDRVEVARAEEAERPAGDADQEDAEPLPSAAPSARRCALLDALRWMAATERGARLVEAVRNEPTPELLDLLGALRAQPHRDAARALAVELLDYADPRLRAGAVRLLGVCRALQPDDSFRVLTALDDPAPEVRIAAAEAVWPLQLRDAAPRLIELLDDGEVRRAAHETLKKLARQPLPARRAQWEAWLKREQAAAEEREAAR